MNDYLDNKINHIHQNFPIHDSVQYEWRRDSGPDSAVEAMRAFMLALNALDVECRVPRSKETPDYNSTEAIAEYARSLRGGQKKQIDVIKPPVQQTKPSIYGTSPRRVK